MTKHVRIENACNSNYKVSVKIYEKGRNGEPDAFVKEVVLGYPTAMTDSSVFITSTQYLVVSEIAPETTP